MTRKILIDDLSRNFFFQGIDLMSLSTLDDKYFEEKSFQAGDIIIEEGTYGEEMYFIAGGEVRITKVVQGEEVELDIKKTNDYFGEVALLDGQKRSARVTALQPVLLYSLNKKNLFHIMNLFDQIKNNLIQSIAACIRRNGDKIKEDSLRNDELLLQKNAELLGVKSLLMTTLEVQRELNAKKKELEEINKKLAAKNVELYRSTIIDELTQVYSRSHLMKLIEGECGKSQRHNYCFSCIIIDIDYFKNFNDTYGHLTGDVVLRETAQLLQAHIRKEDILGRYGGEEFVLILPHMNSSEARVAAEKLRRTVEEEVFSVEGKELQVTISLGVADNCYESLYTGKRLIHLADMALYQAKDGGRNRVAVYHPACVPQSS